MWGNDEYTYNLRTICQHDRIEPHRAGLVCSLMQRWYRAEERALEQKAETHAHVVEILFAEVVDLSAPEEDLA